MFSSSSILFLFLLFLSFRPPFSAPSALHQPLAAEPTIRPELIEALLSESLRLHLVQACQGEHVSLQCPRHTYISPLNSFFGRLVPSRELCPSEKTAGGGEEDTSCDFAETHSRVQEQCRAKRKCRLWVRPELFGERDPCPNTGKYLQIGYKCSPVSFEDQNFCEGQQTRLGCKSGQRLSIYSAHYGRTANGQAMHCDGGKGGQVVGQDCVSDVLPQIARRCHAQSWCSFPVDDRFLGNPCPRGTPKYLSIIFVCVNEEVFSDAALRGKLEAMDELGKELDAIRRNATSKELEKTLPSNNGPIQQRHPLLGDNWMEEDEQLEEDEEEREGENKKMRSPPKMEVHVNGGPDEKKAEEMEKAPKIVVSEWPWAFLTDKREEALSWLLLSILLFSMLLLSICLFWQCRARLIERRGRKLAEERAASITNSGKFLSRRNVGQQSPGYLDSDGSSQRLLDTFLPPLLPHNQPLHSEIYHGCYLPSGGSSGAASAYDGGCGGGDGNYGGYYARDGFATGIGHNDRIGIMGSSRIGRRMPASLHCYS